MKRLSLVVLVVSLLITTNSTFGSIKWLGGAGNWNDPCMWDKGYVPIEDGDEIKVSEIGGVGTATINTVLPDYGLQADGLSSGNKMAISHGSSWYVTTDGWIGIRELKVGDSGAGGNDDGHIVQDGGQITCADVPGKIIVGYKELGVGTYTMSGGTLDGAGQRLFVGTGASSGVATGTFTVIGDGPTINLDQLWVGTRDTLGTVPGTGNIEFQMSAGAVSPINVSASVNIDITNLVAAVANLVVTNTGAAPTAPVVLVQNSSSTAVNGVFDSVTLNGDLGIYTYLTYTYNAPGSDGVANDIALIPEPATLVLLGLGSLVALRRKK